MKRKMLRDSTQGKWLQTELHRQRHCAKNRRPLLLLLLLAFRRQFKQMLDHEGFFEEVQELRDDGPFSLKPKLAVQRCASRRKRQSGCQPGSKDESEQKGKESQIDELTASRIRTAQRRKRKGKEHLACLCSNIQHEGFLDWKQAMPVRHMPPIDLGSDCGRS